MPASTGGREAVVGGKTCERHPLYRLNSDESTRSTNRGDDNIPRQNSLGLLTPREEGFYSSGISSTGNSQIEKGDTMGLHDCKVGTILPAPGRLDLVQHIPDGGWGWVVVGAATCVHMLCNGFHLAFGTLFLYIQEHFIGTDDIETAWLGSLGIGISLFIAPFVTIICRRKSPRMYGVIGGLICALGCLFLAFSRQPEQLFISHCVVMSFGSGVTMATANIMVGRYFKRRRAIAESILLSGSGLGIAFISLLFHKLISVIKWMHGLQCMAGLLILTLIAGALYRSASVYHPRRKDILYLKTHKKNRRERGAGKPPYLDFSALRMRSLQALMVIAAIMGIGVHVPFILLVRTAKQNGVSGDQLLLVSVYLGVGFVAGCGVLGYLTVRTSADCFICRRHLVQTAALAGGGLTLLVVLARDASAFSLYACAYGAAAGAYYLGLKLYTLELVHHQLMERAWSFLSAVQCFPFLFGAPVATYLEQDYPRTSAGYVFAGVTMVLGGLLFYTMPYFQRHPSNDVILQKQNSVCSASIAAEAAALLELDLSESGSSYKPTKQVHCVLGTRGSALHDCLMWKDGSRGGMQVTGGQQGKERERHGSKTSVLSKIAEEKDGSRCSGDAACGAASCGRSSNSLERHKRHEAGGEVSVDAPSDSTFSSKTDKSSNSTSNKAVSESKKTKKNDVRIDLFDPPSQEKESTATVSYDSDLYINLCEAQV